MNNEVNNRLELLEDEFIQEVQNASDNFFYFIVYKKDGEKVIKTSTNAVLTRWIVKEVIFIEDFKSQVLIITNNQDMNLKFFSTRLDTCFIDEFQKAFDLLDRVFTTKEYADKKKIYPKKSNNLL